MCFKRLFLLMILLYKSFKSEAANLPPSSGTKGLKSGGITGRTDIIIHSGLLPLSLNSSIVLMRRINLLLSSSLCVSLSSKCKAGISLSKSMPAKSSFMAGAPMPTLRRAPCFFLASRTWPSVKRSPFLKSVLPVTESIVSSSTT